VNKRIMRSLGFGKEVARVEGRLCPMCMDRVRKEDFVDAKSLREFTISGLCQRCQDATFKGDKSWER